MKNQFDKHYFKIPSQIFSRLEHRVNFLYKKKGSAINCRVKTSRSYILEPKFVVKWHIKLKVFRNRKYSDRKEIEAGTRFIL